MKRNGFTLVEVLAAIAVIAIIIVIAAPSYCDSYCTGTNYYRLSGWSNYSGSGSSLTCYKDAK